jgi:hypothetical protein
MVRAAQVICENLHSIPCIGDADTGFGNEANVQRTVAQYAQVGLAGLMIEGETTPLIYPPAFISYSLSSTVSQTKLRLRGADTLKASR